MKYEDLEEYEEQEREIARREGELSVEAGYIARPERIFRDKRLSSRLALHRTGAPLPMIMLLYEQVVAFFPPISKSKLEARFGLKLEEILAHIESQRLVPVIGHPTDYANNQLFDRIFEIARPASVWARGDEIAHAFCDGESYWQQARRGMDTDRLATTPLVINKWRRHFPHHKESDLVERATIELLTNYVDLCIFGLQPLAEEAVAHPDPSTAGALLMGWSELMTYPGLMSGGGTAQYSQHEPGAPNVLGDHALVGIHAVPADARRYREYGPEADLLFTGLSLDRVLISPQELDAFHRDSMAPRLWKALTELEACVAQADFDDALSAAACASTALDDALTAIRSPAVRREIGEKHDKVDRATGRALKVVSGTAIAAIGIALAEKGVLLALLGAAGASAVQGNVLTPARREAVVDSITSRLVGSSISPLAAQLWRIDRWNAERH